MIYIERDGKDVYKVIIGITTYNLENYIEQALKSILEQKTDFEYKIIIADDASTDSTIDIIHNYQRKYPDKIELLLAESNMGSLANSNRIFEKLNCEYFSFLDGDDYWVDLEHLQKQVDFLDKNKKYTMCAGNTQYMINNILDKKINPIRKLDKAYYFSDFLTNNIPFFHTSAILFRNIIFDKGLPECYRTLVGTFESCAVRGEDFRRILHLEKGPIYAMSEVMSVYRIHEKGMWQGSSRCLQLLETAISLNYYSKYFENRYGDYFKLYAEKAYKNFIGYLVTNNMILNKYYLTEKENKLLCEYLCDLSRDKNNIRNKEIPLKRMIKSLFVKMIVYLK